VTNSHRYNTEHRTPDAQDLVSVYSRSANERDIGAAHTSCPVGGPVGSTNPPPLPQLALLHHDTGGMSDKLLIESMKAIPSPKLPGLSESKGTIWRTTEFRLDMQGVRMDQSTSYVPHLGGCRQLPKARHPGWLKNADSNLLPTFNQKRQGPLVSASLSSQ